MARMNLARLELAMRGGARLPVMVTQALTILAEQEPDFDALARVIGSDPVLSARIIAMAGSPMFGRGRSPNGVRSACLTLGLDTLRSVVLTVGIARHLHSNEESSQTLSGLWEHACATAAAARSIAPLFNVQTDMAYTAGLLHDIGKIVLVRYAWQDYLMVIAEQQARDCFVIDAERYAMGMDHTEIGAHVARLWNLPDYLVDVIANHHRPSLSVYPRIVDTVQVANMLARALDLGSPGDPLVPPLHTVTAERHPLAVPALAARFADIERNYDEVVRLMD